MGARPPQASTHGVASECSGSVATAHCSRGVAPSPKTLTPSLDACFATFGSHGSAGSPVARSSIQLKVSVSNRSAAHRQRRRWSKRCLCVAQAETAIAAPTSHNGVRTSRHDTSTAHRKAAALIRRWSHAQVEALYAATAGRSAQRPPTITRVRSPAPSSAWRARGGGRLPVVVSSHHERRGLSDLRRTRSVTLLASPTALVDCDNAARRHEMGVRRRKQCERAPTVWATLTHAFDGRGAALERQRGRVALRLAGRVAAANSRALSILVGEADLGFDLRTRPTRGHGRSGQVVSRCTQRSTNATSLHRMRSPRAESGTHIDERKHLRREPPLAALTLRPRAVGGRARRGRATAWR